MTEKQYRQWIQGMLFTELYPTMRIGDDEDKWVGASRKCARIAKEIVDVGIGAGVVTPDDPKRPVDPCKSKQPQRELIA